ncbi:hypothetical protein F511_42341 [Dorcoceras hygrometricum]|uniref:Uncharacterized protein n=1 Tax=Dorcoceras hygrometricum TaxID=472368 RepID=A0A2Z7B1T0_9LAMI|nr:hypothetical protein F511_42341 [Dorcoceras hygrometricum]
MCCPGQARTKPRRKFQPLQQSSGDRRRTPAAAANMQHPATARSIGRDVAQPVHNPSHIDRATVREGGSKWSATIRVTVRKSIAPSSRIQAATSGHHRATLARKIWIRALALIPLLGKRWRIRIPSPGGAAERAGKDGLPDSSWRAIENDPDVNQTCNSDTVQTMLISYCANVYESDFDGKRNLESAMMTSAFLLEEVVISNYDVSNISSQLDGSVMMTSAVMSSQSAVEQKISAFDKRSARDGATSFKS